MSAVVTKLPRRLTWRAAQLFAQTFMDDPVWAAAGPSCAAHRSAMLRCLYTVELLIAFGRGGYVYGGFVKDRLAGVIIAYPNGQKGSPWWSWLARSVPLIVAGPLSGIRAARIMSSLEAMHPGQPHVHFALVCAKKESRGIGVMLMRWVLDKHVDSDSHCAYLEATAPHLTELYALLGFETQRQYVLSSGEPVATMWRPAVDRSDS